MRALILSDSHGAYRNVAQAVQAAGKVDLIIHCGDGWRDVEAAGVDTPCIQVKGNCDMAPQLPSRVISREKGIDFMVAHGHEYGVKQGLARIIYAAMEEQVQVLCFGHTHVPLVEKQGELLVICPGSIGGERAAYALLEGDARRCTAHIHWLFE